MDRTFALARDGKEAEARGQIRLTLQARQQALSTAVSRLLVQNNESEEQVAQQIREIYNRVQRQVYLFLTATLIAIVLTSLYVIRSNRQLFAQVAALSEQRSDLAQKLISTQESTLRHISRELHDEFGQIFTAMGAMLGRVVSTRRRVRRCAQTWKKFATSRRLRWKSSQPFAGAASGDAGRSWAGKHHRVVHARGGKTIRNRHKL